MFSSTTTLSIGSRNYLIELVAKDANTYSVQISGSTSQVIADLPLDPMDNTLAAVLSTDAISKLGEDVETILNVLSKFLQDKIGAKEFILIPTDRVLPDYIPAQDAAFKRLRHASRGDLGRSSFTILEQHKELVAELDKQYETVLGINELERKLQHDKPYEEIFSLLNKHANFTPGKMTEYKEEDIIGTKARFNNSHVKTLAFLDQQPRLRGIIRSLSTGDNFFYLSDETIDQEIVLLEKFQGNTVDEKAKNRAKFLLAYLINKACSLAKEQDHFLIIAALGREDIYDAVGFQTFPIQSSNYVVMMKLMPPGAELKSIKQRMLEPPSFSNAAAISNVGIMPVQSQQSATTAQPQRQAAIKSPEPTLS